jgi:6,7-dimethyl-8-ribityllumazine synthase
LTIYEGTFTTVSGLRIALVVARFNDLITGKLLSG